MEGKRKSPGCGVFWLTTQTPRARPYFLRVQPCNLPSFSMRLMKLRRDKQNLGMGLAGGIYSLPSACRSTSGKLPKLLRRLYG